MNRPTAMAAIAPLEIPWIDCDGIEVDVGLDPPLIKETSLVSEGVEIVVTVAVATRIVNGTFEEAYR
jgi:hypothetical protein